MTISFNEMRFHKRLLKRITAIFIGFLMACLLIKYHTGNMGSGGFKFALEQYFPDDISCYYEEDIEDDYWLHYIDKFKSTDVYFHWTSCRYTIKLAHLCAIEAASRAYPSDKVYVLFCKPLQFSILQKKLLNIFLEYMKSVKFVRISVTNYFNETPFIKTVGGFLNSRLLKKHKRLEEALKLTTLYRNGGIVVDTNVIVTEIRDIPKHWLVQEKRSISSAMLSFKTDKVILIEDGMKLLEDKYQNYSLSSFLTDQYNLCLGDGDCQDFVLLDKEIVNVEYTDKATKIPPAFAYRVVDKVFERRFPHNSLLGVIAKKYCPFVYSKSYLFN